MTDVIKRLEQVLQSRRDAHPESSYVASLHHKGLNKILEKVGEECTEVVIAAKDAQQTKDNDELVNEMADLWFHSLVLLSHQGTNADAVFAVLEKRFGLSGLEEKRNRQK